MSENSVNNPEFKFKIRDFSFNKSDFKENKKEKFLFNYLSESLNFLEKLDMAKESKGVITSEDINIFLANKDVQKNNITESDVINFLNKVEKLNPTEENLAYSKMNFVDENNQPIINKDLKEYFSSETRYDFEFQKDFINQDGTIKKGFEVFDLNNDKKLDNIELNYINQTAVGQKGYNQLNNYLSSLDNLDSSDNVVTKQAKQTLYQNLETEENKKLLSELKNITIKGDFDKKLVTSEIINMFQNGEKSLNFNDICDSTGHLKSGFEMFDLNGDLMLDEKEKAFFSSGGHPISDDNSKLSLKNLVQSIEILDKIGFDKNYCENRADNIVTSDDKKNLYKMISASNEMLDNITELPKELQEKYKNALKNIYLGNYTNSYAFGHAKDNTIAINCKLANTTEISSILIHELTHYLLNKNGMESSTMQEVETFYMEYKLYSEAKKNPDYMKDKKSFYFGIESNAIDMEYMNYADKLKSENPNIPEKELAVKAFVKTHYDYYKNHYMDVKSPEELEKLVKENNKYVYLK